MAANMNPQEIKTIEIEIDGRILPALPNQTVIQVADAAGIYIPRFCYHKHLSIPANCRMCLVEMEKSPKAVPACATPVAAGMKIFTKSAKTIAAQRAVMEFLLINHPLDCPICDQGGECELQDLAMGYGSGHSSYTEAKHCEADQNLGPLISTEMTRCIKCTRCVRFGDEVAGLRELGAIGRGEDTDISTYVKHAIQSEVSGNIIDLCPVGALTAKPSRFTARAWELKQAPGVSPHDCIGSNLNIHTLNGDVKRVVARENSAMNTTWLADRDRYSYTGLYADDRLQAPLAKIHGEWQTVEWETALQMAAAGLQKIVAEESADQLGVLASPNATVEEFYLLQRLTRGLGSPHIDHRLRAQDTRDTASAPLFPGLLGELTDLAQCDAIVLVGSNIQKEQPIAGLFVRQAALKGAAIVVINPVDYTFHFNVAAKAIIAPQQMLSTLQALTLALAQHGLPRRYAPRNDEKDDAASVVASAAKQSSDALVAALLGKQKIAVLLGAAVQHHPDASCLRLEANKLAHLLNAHLGILTEGANSAGGWLAGALPEREAAGAPAVTMGLNAYEMLAKPRLAYVLLNVEPEYDCANPSIAKQALAQASFVVALASYRNEAILAHANVILPITPFTETAGTFVNVSGVWQSFQGVAQPRGESRPAWKVLRVLANFMHLADFDYESVEAIRKELQTIIANTAFNPLPVENMASKDDATLMRIGEVPLYAGDSLVRRANPLQEAQAIMLGHLQMARMHAETAKRWQLQDGDKVEVRQGEAKVVMSLMIDNTVARDAVSIAGGIAATADLGELYGPVAIKKI